MNMMSFISIALIASFLTAPEVNAFTQIQKNTHRTNGSLLMSSPKVNRRDLLFSAGVVSTSLALLLPAAPAHARLEAVNRPDLLPKEAGLNVIQIEKFLTTGQAKRMSDLLTTVERNTGFRVRVLCQAYPQTPGLAIRDYWDLAKEGQKDDKYIVLVVDQFGGKGNVLNFNVGEGVKFALPNVFWTRLQGKYGTLSFVRENGIDIAITNAIEAVATCLQSEDFCVNVPTENFSTAKNRSFLSMVLGSKPLHGIRVIECGHLVAGPFAGTILAHYGAPLFETFIKKQILRYDGIP